MKEEKNKTRIDSKRAIALVTQALLKDPSLSDRDIEKKYWVSKSAVHRARKKIGDEVGHIDIIQQICKKDIGIVQKVLKVIEWRVDNADGEWEERVSTRDLISIADTSAKRYSLFAWDATDDKWGLKDYSQLSLLELEQERQRILWQ